jgi:anaerobic glycerol-3-phosphate dehydrogenase
MAAGVGVSIPENEFLRQKAIHLRKVAISRLLDQRPFANLALVRLQLWIHHTFRRAGNSRSAD